jgi:hypothetical protein
VTVINRDTVTDATFLFLFPPLDHHLTFGPELVRTSCRGNTWTLWRDSLLFPRTQRLYTLSSVSTINFFFFFFFVFPIFSFFNAFTAIDGLSANIFNFSHKRESYHYLVICGSDDPPASVGLPGDVYTQSNGEIWLRTKDGVWVKVARSSQYFHPVLGSSRVLDVEKLVWVARGTLRMRKTRLHGTSRSPFRL